MSEDSHGKLLSMREVQESLKLLTCLSLVPTGGISTRIHSTKLVRMKQAQENEAYTFSLTVDEIQATANLVLVLMLISWPFLVVK